jgi:hypothetical protein
VSTYHACPLNHLYVMTQAEYLRPHVDPPCCKHNSAKGTIPPTYTCCPLVDVSPAAVAFALDTPQLRVAPGASIQEVTDKYAPPVDSSMFAAWLLRWVQGNPLAADHGARSSSSGSASSNSTFASSAGPCRAAPLLRQLWLLLQGRCYSPWMLWVAAALDRVGEQQLACEAAAQGMLPGACSLLDIKNVQKAYASCLTAILPQLAQSGEHLVRVGASPSPAVSHPVVWVGSTASACAWRSRADTSGMMTVH